MNAFLHVGYGHKRKDRTNAGFSDWKELRFDIDETDQPYLVGTMTDMSCPSSTSVNAIFSSHNIEHLYPHEVPKALAEFVRVLSDDGFAVITCPDIQFVCALIAQDKHTEQAYTLPAVHISPLDILYDHRASMALGNLYTAHRCGFSKRVLTGTLQTAGFASVVSIKRGAPFFYLWALASKTACTEEEIKSMAKIYFTPL